MTWPMGGRPVPVVVRVAAGTSALVTGLLGLSVLSTGLGVLLVAAAMLFGAGGLVLARRDPGRQVLGDTVSCALFGCSSVLVGAGLTIVLGPVGVPLVLLGVALAGWRLAREWSRSHEQLGRAREVATVERLRDLRRSLLDEMERRDPAGFRRWTGGAGWITGDSAPFLGT